MLRKRDKLVIWPVYLDTTKSRGEGRLAPKKHSVKEPTLKEVQIAASELGLNPVVEADKAYPKSWWKVSGRVLIDRKAPKSRIIQQIGKIIKKNRS
ncbi:signal recognition particle protein Srp19 [Methanosarcinales archaeon]|nr:MAG: signal recognition particle protein Srp19 [Methanosarcinales archaeon]